MTILVTGGAGFIGSHLCDYLLQLGEQVICLDNLNNYYSPLRKIENISHNLKKNNFTFVAVDITNKEQLEKVFRDGNEKENKITKIVHLAARAGVRPSLSNPELYTKVNILGTLNLLELAKKYHVSQFIFGSSSSVYGGNEKVPFSEDDPVNFPVSPYAASKRAAELYCQTYSRLYGLNITCLRFFTVYGPRGRPDMAPYLFTSRIMEGKPIKMFGDGSSKRDYTYVADIIEGIIAALNTKFLFEIINLGNSKPVILKDFITVIERTVGEKAIINRCPEQPGDMQKTNADISKAQNLLKYNPKVGLKEGLEKFTAWYKHEK